MAKSGKRGPYKVGIERRRAIIEQATSAFASNGYYGGTMQDIADRVGVPPAALSRYFASKQALLEAVADDALTRWRAYVDEMAGPHRRGLDYIRALPRVIDYMERNPGIAGLLMMLAVEGASPAHPAHRFIAERNRATRESFSRHIAEAVDDGEIPHLSAPQIAMEADQLMISLQGALLLVAQRANSSDLAATTPRAVDVFSAVINATVSRWRATVALQQ